MISVDGRKNLEIIEYERHIVTDEEMEAFEHRLDDKLEMYNDFSDYYFNQLERRQTVIDDKRYIEAIKSMEAENKLLKSILRNKFQVDNNK